MDVMLPKHNRSIIKLTDQGGIEEAVVLVSERIHHQRHSAMRNACKSLIMLVVGVIHNCGGMLLFSK